MHRTNKYVALALGVIVSAGISVFALRESRSPRTEFYVPLASPRVVLLHVSNRGALAINSDSVPNGRLAGRLREIYGTRAEGFLYIFPENDTPAQCIADVIDVVHRLLSENMNIQIRLVSTGALYSVVSARLTGKPPK